MWCEKVSNIYILQISEAKEFNFLLFKKDCVAKLGTEFLFPEFQFNELRVRNTKRTKKLLNTNLFPNNCAKSARLLSYLGE